ncbi:hypothetical protein NicSoilE8_39970 [Arthrobacter sp. NicSoilE8]|nr:hypothetical protein NicSoilE8_39970 [Arthrobacter sp. NicSoilE8]
MAAVPVISSVMRERFRTISDEVVDAAVVLALAGGFTGFPFDSVPAPGVCGMLAC